MKRLFCGILLFSFTCAIESYAQARLKLIENNHSPTLNEAVEAHKQKDGPKAEALYNQFAKEMETFANELATKDSLSLSTVNLNVFWTDFLHYLYNIGLYYIHNEEPQEHKETMEGFLVKALDYCIEQKRENHEIYAHLLSLGPYFTNDPEHLEYFYTKSVSIFKEQLGNQHITYADAVTRLANFYLEKGYHLKAEELLLEILPIYDKYYTKDDWDYIDVLCDLVVIYFELRNWEKTKYYALTLTQILDEVKDVDVGTISMYMSSILPIVEQLDKVSISDFESIKLLGEKAAGHKSQMIQEYLGELSNEYIKDLVERGSQSLYNGYMEQSDSLYRKALELEKELNGIDSPLHKEIQYAIQANATKEGRIKRLRNLLEEEKKIDTHSDEVMDLYMALFGCHRDEPDSASFYLSEWQKSFTKQTESKIHFFTERDREIWWKWVSFNLFSFKMIATDIFFENNEAAFLGYAYNTELFFKSTLLTSSQKLRQSIFSSNDPSLIEEWSKLSHLRENENLPNTEFLVQLEKSIVSKSQVYRDEHQYFDIEWTHIKEHLQPEEVAIEFMAFNGEIDGEYKDIYLGLMIRADYDYPEVVWYALEEEIIEAIHSKDKNALYEAVWLPIEQYLEDEDIIYLAPAGLLHSISFGSLSYGDGKYYLCEDYTIHNLLTTKDIIKLKGKKRGVVKQKQIALFGGADYLLPMGELALLDKDFDAGNSNNLNRSLLDEMDPLRGPGFTFLPGSKREVQQIDKYLTNQNWKSSLFMDKEATETRFKSLSSTQSPEVIHISTHGFYFPQSQMETNKKKSFSNIDKHNLYRLSDNPLMRSGLAFAGANHVWKGNDPIDGVDDGILTAYEISNLNLFNTELVVLSACNTGLGDIDFGEGVYGLQRAFRLAGVETMIVSLWEVPDKETVELMTTFYSLWGKGMSKKEAFDKAQMQMRYAYPDHPEKWAGFIMIE